MTIYVVKHGDTLSGIAKHHGIHSWQALYNDPSNTAFRAKRPNPNLIFPGDQVNIPTKGATGPAPHPQAVAAAAAAAPFDYHRYGIFAKNVPAMRAELNKDAAVEMQKMKDEEFLKFLEETKTDWDKKSWISDRLADSIKVVRFYKGLKAIGVPMSEMKAIIPVLANDSKGDKLVLAILEAEGPLTSVLKGLSKAGKLAAILFMIGQIYGYCEQSEYGAAASEFYKTGIGMGVPIGALIDATEGIVTKMLGTGVDHKNLRILWKVLRGFNPVAMGGAAVDIFGTLVQMMVSKKADDQRLDRLIGRLKNSPAQVWLELGEKI
jgi:hypothetical protein